MILVHSSKRVKRKKETAASNKAISVVYSLAGYRVCRHFFLKTLDVSNKRVRNVTVKKQHNSSGVAFRDKRGKKEPTNKISPERIAIVEEHISSFPKYVSHYSRVHNPYKKYLRPDLNLSIMYDLYKKFCFEEKQVQPEKESYYRKVFNTKFNLSFHRPQTDTCVTCDRLLIKILHGTINEKGISEKEKNYT